MKHKAFRPDRVQDYFLAEWKVLLIVTVTGLVYNVGLLARPWFEGQMTGKLVDILTGSAAPREMGTLALGYALTILVVQGNRYFKRFYVRRFANNVSRRMKQVLYAKLVARSRVSLISEGEGSIMTKAIGDVDDCVEGMRKFTTELFDTGVALLAYCGMLLHYDWRLALICMLFPPISYAAAEKLKTVVQKTGEQRKEQSAALNAATLDRARNALTYRVFGREEERRAAYEEHLTAYEHAAVKANLWTASLPPLYRVLSMIGAALILYFGGKNVLGTGWTVWSIAEFTTFLACFTKLATKSSKAAKLFNAVHKAQVSWKRIQPLMREIPAMPAVSAGRVERLEVRDLACGYPGDTPLPGADHRRHRPGGLWQIHAGQGISLRAALRRQHPAGRPGAGGAVPLGADGPRGVSGPRSGAVQRHDPGKCAAGRHGRSHGLPPGCVSGRRSGGHDGGAGDPGGHRRRPAFRRSGPAAGAGPDAGPSKTPADSGRSLFGAGPGHGDGDLRPSAAFGGGQCGDSDLSPAVPVPGAGSGDLAGKRGGQGGDPRGIGGEYPGLRGAV